MMRHGKEEREKGRRAPLPTHHLSGDGGRIQATGGHPEKERLPLHREVIRRTLTGRQIKLFHRDASLDEVVEELASVREELRAIGVNINQITRHFNASTGAHRRVLLSHQALEQYQKMEQKVNLLLSLISKLARRW